MPLPLSRDSLQRALAGSLARHILPPLDDHHDRALVEACITLIAREEVQRRTPATNADESLDADIRLISDTAGTPAAARKSVEQRVREMIGEFSEVQQSAFPQPSANALTAMLRGRFPDDAGGTSKQSVLFDKVSGNGHTEPLVMRRDYPNSFVATSVTTEFPLLSGLWRSGYIVPEPLWLETGSTHVPGIHMVMRKVDGSQAGDHRGARADLVERGLELMADLLGRLHALPVRELGIPGFSDAAFDEASQLESIDYWYQRYRSDADRPEPI